MSRFPNFAAYLLTAVVASLLRDNTCLIFHFFKLLSMYKGTVKFYNEAKGYGFIVEEGTGQEIFLHVTGLDNKIRNGDEVVFETKKSKKGMTAVSVKVA